MTIKNLGIHIKTKSDIINANIGIEDFKVNVNELMILSITAIAIIIIIIKLF